MDVTITARHCEIPGSLRQRAEQRIASLGRLESRATAATVIFDLDHGVSRAELKLFTRGVTSVAHGSGASFREAFDEAFERLERQLGRRHDQRIARRRAGAQAPIAEAEPLP